MEDPVKPPHQHQPVSIHDAGGHPVAIAAAVIFIPLFVCLVAASFLLLNLTKRSSASSIAAVDLKPGDVLQKQDVENAVGRQAVCNDGSPAAYYHRPGVGSDANRWIIFLEGGGPCLDDASCSERFIKEPQRTSSTDYPETISPRGIFSTSADENPHFWNATHVYVKYCSSDAWVGDMTRTINGESVEFRGAAIIEAVFEDLDGLHNAHEILFSGSDVGGIGVAQHLDSLSQRFSNASVKGVVANLSQVTPELDQLGRYVNAEIKDAPHDPSKLYSVDQSLDQLSSEDLTTLSNWYVSTFQ